MGGGGQPERLFSRKDKLRRLGVWNSLRFFSWSLAEIQGEEKIFIRGFAF